jgi:hypothetical protein
MHSTAKFPGEDKNPVPKILRGEVFAERAHFPSAESLRVEILGARGDHSFLFIPLLRISQIFPFISLRWIGVCRELCSLGFGYIRLHACGGECAVAFRTRVFQAMSATNCSSKSAQSTPGAQAANPVTSPACKLQDSLKDLSLSNLHVVLEGIMTVDVAAVPATIYNVEFDSGNTDSSIWTTPSKDQRGEISGVYLSGGTPTVVDGTGKAIPGITISAVADGSTDTELPFTMKLTNCIPPNTKIYFVVNKSPDTSSTNGAATSAKQKPSNTVGSTPFAFALPSYTCPPAPESNSQGSGPNAQPSSGTNGSDSGASTPQGSGANAQPSSGTTGSNSGAPAPQGNKKTTHHSNPPNPKQQY